MIATGSRCLEHGSFRNDALADVAPQGDEELAGERHNRNPAYPSLPRADPRLKPLAQGRVRLMAQPEPGEFDHLVTQPAIARLRDTLVPVDTAALPGAGRQSRIRGNLVPRNVSTILRHRVWQIRLGVSAVSRAG